MNDYCNTCIPVLRLLTSCPRASIFAEGNAAEIALETIWVICSVSLVVIFASLALNLVFGRTTRVLFFSFSLGIQQIFNELILKRAVVQARPHGACSTSYGMPSGHATFAGGLVMWLLLEWIVFHDKATFKKHRFYKVLKYVGLVLAPCIAISRHFLNYHSPAQILIGALGGFLWTSIIFTLMVIMIHRNEGKFYSTRVHLFLKKIKYTCNYIHFHEEARQEDAEAQSSVPQLILPLRESLRRFFKNTPITKEPAKMTNSV